MALANLPLLVCYGVAEALAAASLLQKFRRERSASGVSYQTLTALAVGHGLSCVFALGLPTGVTSVAYGILSLFSFLCLVLVLRIAFCYFPRTYTSASDSFGSAVFPREIGGLSLHESCSRVLRSRAASSAATSSEGGHPLAASPLANSTLNENLTDDCLNAVFLIRVHWLALYVLAFGLALGTEALRRHKTMGLAIGLLGSSGDWLLGLALLPQITMMYRSNRAHSAVDIGHAVAYWLCARALSLAFWYLDERLPGRGVKLLCEPLNLLCTTYILLSQWWVARKTPLILPL